MTELFFITINKAAELIGYILAGDAVALLAFMAVFLFAAIRSASREDEALGIDETQYGDVPHVPADHDKHAA